MELQPAVERYVMDGETRTSAAGDRSLRADDHPRLAAVVVDYYAPDAPTYTR